VDLEHLSGMVYTTRDLPGVIVEVGSYKCGATAVLAEAAVKYTNPIKDVYAFDIFGGLPYENQETFLSFADADFEEILEFVRPYSNIKLIRGKHEETIPNFKKEISLIFLDSDFYSSHFVALKNFWPLLPSKGAIVFHDWKFDDVQRAIRDSLPTDEWTWNQFSNSNMAVIHKI
jgi:hypothetical protein